MGFWFSILFWAPCLTIFLICLSVGHITPFFKYILVPLGASCLCVLRFHVVSLQNGLDRQVSHTWVFGKVALGPELVLEHLGKVPDVLPRRGLQRQGTTAALFTTRGVEGGGEHTHL